ncbi:Suppressor of Profilin deletion, partial [Dispira simplex]
IQLHSDLVQEITSKIEKPLREFPFANKEWCRLRSVQPSVATAVKSFVDKDQKIAKLKKVIEVRKSSRKAQSASHKLNNTAMSFETSKHNWQAKIPPVLEQFEAMDRQRLAGIKDIVCQFENIRMRHFDQLARRADHVKSALTQVNVEEELIKVTRDRKALATWNGPRSPMKDHAFFTLPSRTSLKSHVLSPASLSTSSLSPTRSPLTVSAQLPTAMPSSVPSEVTQSPRSSRVSGFTTPISEASPIVPAMAATIPAQSPETVDEALPNPESQSPSSPTEQMEQTDQTAPMSQVASEPSRPPPLVDNTNKFYSDDDSDGESVATPRVKFNINKKETKESSEEANKALSRVTGSLRLAPSVRRRNRRDARGIYGQMSDLCNSSPAVHRLPVDAGSSVSLPASSVITSGLDSVAELLTNTPVVPPLPVVSSKVAPTVRPRSATSSGAHRDSAVGVSPGKVQFLTDETLHLRCTGHKIDKIIVTGEVKLQATNVSASTLASARITCQGTQNVDQLVVNSKYLATHMVNDSSTYSLSLGTYSPSSSSRTTLPLLKYQYTIRGHEACQTITPLRMRSLWKCQNEQVSLVVMYEPNPLFTMPTIVEQLRVSVPLRGKVRQVLTRPEGLWNPETQVMVWQLGDIPLAPVETPKNSEDPKETSTNGQALQPTRLLLRAQTTFETQPSLLNVHFICKHVQLVPLVLQIVFPQGPTSNIPGLFSPPTVVDPVRTLTTGKYLLMPPRPELRHKGSLVNLSLSASMCSITPSSPVVSPALDSVKPTLEEKIATAADATTSEAEAVVNEDAKVLTDGDTDAAQNDADSAVGEAEASASDDTGVSDSEAGSTKGNSESVTDDDIDVTTDTIPMENTEVADEPQQLDTLVKPAAPLGISTESTVIGLVPDMIDSGTESDYQSLPTSPVVVLK